MNHAVTKRLAMLTPRRLILFAFWCALTALTAVPEAPAQYRFDSWTTENGLPHKGIHAVLQTRDAYLWLTTTDGLVRFDGVRFTVFDTASGRGFKSNRCTALFEDPSGDLWVGTEDNGVMRYRDGHFTTYTTADGLPSNDVRAMGGTADGELMVVTYSGAAQWRDGRFKPYLANNVPLPFPIFGFDGVGGLWYVEGGTLRRATPQGTSSYAFDRRVFPAYIAGGFQDRQGTFWISAKEPSVGPSERGLYRIKGDETRVYTSKDGLPASAVCCFCEDREGNLWIGTMESGLLRLRDGRFTRYTTADGLSSNRISAIHQDREGVIWIGTVDNGLNRMSKQIITTYSAANGLAANNTYPVYEDAGGTMWIGSWGGMTKIENGRFTHYNEKDGLAGLHMSLFKDREGTLWIGSFPALTRLRDGRFEVMASFGNKNKIDLPDAATLAIHQDRQGDIWFGTFAGLVRYKEGAVTVYTSKEGLPDEHIQAIHESRDGTLRVGTHGGLARFDQDRFVAYTEPEGPSGDRIR